MSLGFPWAIYYAFKKINCHWWNVKLVQHFGTFFLFPFSFFFFILCNVEMAVTTLLLVLSAQVIGT